VSSITCPKCQRDIPLSLDDLRAITVLECARCGERIVLRDPPPAPSPEPETVPSTVYQPDTGAPRWYHNPVAVWLVLLLALLASNLITGIAVATYVGVQAQRADEELRKALRELRRLQE
jgi:hypothetical protein